MIPALVEALGVLLLSSSSGGSSGGSSTGSIDRLRPAQESTVEVAATTRPFVPRPSSDVGAVAAARTAALSASVQFLRNFLRSSSSLSPVVPGGGGRTALAAADGIAAPPAGQPPPPSQPVVPERTRLVSAHLSGLVSTLSRLAAKPRTGGSSATREAALGCLEALAQLPLPYYELHPHKGQVRPARHLGIAPLALWCCAPLALSIEPFYMISRYFV